MCCACLAWSLLYIGFDAVTALLEGFSKTELPTLKSGNLSVVCVIVYFSQLSYLSIYATLKHYQSRRPYLMIDVMCSDCRVPCRRHVDNVSL